MDRCTSRYVVTYTDIALRHVGPHNSLSRCREVDVTGNLIMIAPEWTGNKLRWPVKQFVLHDLYSTTLRTLLCLGQGGEVQHLSSSLDATEQRHACRGRGEIVTFTCEVTGTMLLWITSSDPLQEHRLIFFENDRVDEVRVTQKDKRAILLHNDPTNVEGMRRLSSALLIPVDSQMGSTISISCSAGVESPTMSRSYGISGQFVQLIRCTYSCAEHAYG